MEVAEVWRRLLGTEFEQFRRFLMPTDIIAARYPGTDPRIPCRVIVEETGVIVVDDVSGQQHELSRSDVICHRVNMRALAKELSPLLNCILNLKY